MWRSSPVPSSSSSRSLLGQVPPGDVDVDPVRLGDRLEQPPVIHRGRLRPRLERALGDRERRVGDDQLRVDHPLEAEPVAARAAAVRRVEREDPRLELGHRGAAVEAGERSRTAAPRRACRRRPASTLAPGPSAMPRRRHRPSARPRPGRRRAARPPRATRRGACAAPSFITRRSTTIEMSCLYFLSSSIVLVEPAQLAVDHRAGVALRRASPRAASRTRPCARGRPAPGP